MYQGRKLSVWLTWILSISLCVRPVCMCVCLDAVICTCWDVWENSWYHKMLIATKTPGLEGERLTINNLQNWLATWIFLLYYLCTEHPGQHHICPKLNSQSTSRSGFCICGRSILPILISSALRSKLCSILGTDRDEVFELLRLYHLNYWMFCLHSHGLLILWISKVHLETYMFTQAFGNLFLLCIVLYNVVYGSCKSLCDLCLWKCEYI